MKQVKWLIGAAFMVGMPFPILLTDYPHQWWFAFVALASAFIGSGIIFGFSKYKTLIQHFGDLSDTPLNPKINQVWLGFFISAVINLFWANMYIS
jgi:hypothetical protein